MSGSAPSPTSSSTGQTSNGSSPPPPISTFQAPSPGDSASSPPPPSSTNPSSEPQSGSQEPNSPPPSQSLPVPQNNSSSLNQTPPSPSPPLNNPPSSPTPPHSVPSPTPSSPPPSQIPSSPSPPVPPLGPIVSLPPPVHIPGSTPPNVGPQNPILPPQIVNPPVLGSSTLATPPPTLPVLPSSIPNTLPALVTPENQSPPVPSNQGQIDHPSSVTSTENPSSSSSTPSLDSSKSNNGFGRGVALGIALAGVVVILVAILFLVTRKKKKKSNKHGALAVYQNPSDKIFVKMDGRYRETSKPQSPSSATGTFGSHEGSHLPYSDAKGSGLGNFISYFTYEEVSDMTHGFSKKNLLGEGGFGCVYKGWLLNGKPVAVKQPKANSGHGEREFRAEVEIISRVHHRHLVSLIGYCISASHRLLVYEFVPNKTLEHHLHGRGLPVMDWSKRIKVAIGAARGLAYLHEDCHPKIIHRDIKSANILLNDSFEAQVADFGFAKMSNDAYTHVSTRVMGTFGYMAPEYASSGKLTDKADIFSFGVVLLELITGHRPVDPSLPLGEDSVVEWARPLINHALKTGDFEELVDPRLANNYAKAEMHRMMEAAVACVRHSAPKRPCMVQVVRLLETEGAVVETLLSDISNGVQVVESELFDSKATFEGESCSSDYTEEYDNSSVTQSGGDFESREFQRSHEFSLPTTGMRRQGW